MQNSSELSGEGIPEETIQHYQRKRSIQQKLPKEKKEKEAPSQILNNKPNNFKEKQIEKKRKESIKQKKEERKNFIRVKTLKTNSGEKEPRVKIPENQERISTGLTVSLPNQEILDQQTYASKINSLKFSNKYKNFFLVVAVMLGCAASGYNDVIGNVIAIPMTKHIYKLSKEEQLQMTGNFYVSLSVGAVLACMSVSVFANLIGRTRSLLLIEAAKTLACVVMNIKNLKVFMGMMMVSGFLAGVQGSIVMILMRELFPPKISDKSGFLFYITASSFATVAGYLGVAFGSEEKLAENWRVAISWPALVSLMSFSGVLFLLGCNESPQFYVETEKDFKKLTAKMFGTMSKIYNKESALKFIDYKLFEVRKKLNFLMKQMMESKRKLSEGKIVDKKDWRALFTRRYLTQIVLGTALSMLKELAGVSIILYFSTQFFDDIFEDGKGAGITLILSIGYFVGALLSYFSIILGRRSGWLLTSIAHSLALLGMIVGVIQVSWWIVAVSGFIYTVSYTPGLGSILRLYLVEILPPSGIAVASTLKWVLLAWLCAVVPTAQIEYGVLTILEFHFFFSVVVCIVIFSCVFETDGLSNEEIEIIFQKQKSCFNFGKREGLPSKPPSEASQRAGDMSSQRDVTVVVDEQMKGFETDRTQHQRLINKK